MYHSLITLLVIGFSATLGWCLYKPKHIDVLCPRCKHMQVIDVRTTINNCSNCNFLFPMKMTKRGELVLDTIEYNSYIKYYNN